jgi:hypothetical protein
MNTSAGSVVGGSLIVVTTLWMALALHYHRPERWVRWLISLLPIAVVLGSLVLLPHSWTCALSLAMFAVVWLWWFTRRPLGNRDWALGMDILPRVQIEGDLVHVEHFRCFDYGPSGDPRPHYEQRTFDLSKVCSVDYFLSHWKGPIIAHTLVSFGFDDGQFMAISVEARRQRWQRYSPFWGLFRAYELMFVIGDERDLVRLRTNVRRERVYMYRLRLPVDRVRTLLRDYLQRAQAVAQRPQWYNSIASNCTTNLFYHQHRQTRWWLRPGIFLNGLSARTLYRLGALATDVSFRELQARGAIQNLALEANDSSEFSQRIRAGIIGSQPAVEACGT